MSSLVPESVPMHQHSSKKFHSLHTIDVSTYYKECQRQFYESAMQLINSGRGYEELSPLVYSLTEAYNLLSKQESKAHGLIGKVQHLKDEYKLISDKCEPVSLDTWDQYRNKELTAPKLSELYKDSLEQEVSSSAETASTDKDKVLRVLQYIWNDPISVIPDGIVRGCAGTGEDDDLQIEGGIIELSCPITCKPFEVPMISKKCGHVFDKTGITSYLEGHAERDCPQGACNQKVSIKDFIPDEIMSLRCHIDRIKQVNAVDTNNYEELDTI